MLHLRYSSAILNDAYIFLFKKEILSQVIEKKPKNEIILRPKTLLLPKRLVLHKSPASDQARSRAGKGRYRELNPTKIILVPPNYHIILAPKLS